MESSRRKTAVADRPVAGYLRVSKERDGMQAHLQYRQQIENYAKTQGVKVAEWFEDIDRHGGGIEHREALVSLIGRREEFGTVIVPKVDRFSRSVIDLLNLCEQFNEAGVRIVFLDAPQLNVGDEYGELTLTIMGALARLERRRIGTRWKDTYNYGIANGKRSGGNAIPLGYALAKETTFKPVRAEANIVRSIFRRYLAGESISSMARDLNERKVPTKQGGKWYYRTISMMLENEAYAGLIERDKRKRQTAGEFGPRDLQPAAWKPIVDRNTFDAALAKREKSRDDYSPARARVRADHLLSGILVCEECGAHMHRRNRKRYPSFYYCPNTLSHAVARNGKKCKGIGIKEPLAEQLIYEAFMAAVSGEHVVNVYRKGRRAFGESKARANHAAEIRRLDKKIKNLVAQLPDARPQTTRYIMEQAKDFEDQRDVHQRAIQAQNTSSSGRAASTEQIDTLRKDRANLDRRWHEDWTVAQKRAALQLAIKSVSPKGEPRGHRRELSVELQSCEACAEPRFPRCACTP